MTRMTVRTALLAAMIAVGTLLGAWGVDSVTHGTTALGCNKPLAVTDCAHQAVLQLECLHSNGVCP